MKKPLALLTVTALAAASMEVFPAGTMTGYAASVNMKSKNILLDGRRISNPVGITAVDPSNKKLTTYMPIYYVGTVLQSLGIQNHWDGHTWKLTAPTTRIPGGKVVAPKSVSKNAVMITLNGTTIASAARIVATDPASHKQTTFVPIWYVMQVLKQLNVTSDWNGTTWSLVDLKPLSDAMENTNKVNSMQSNITMDVREHLNLTPQGQADLGSDSSVTDHHVTITSTAQTGVVNGENALNMQMAYHDFGDSSQDDVVQMYAQGQHVWINDNNSGWNDISNRPEAQQLLQDAGPNVDVNIQHLSKTTITSSANGKIYKGVISLNDATDLENSLLDDWTDDTTTPSEKQTFVKEIEKRASVAVAYTMKTVQGSNLVTNITTSVHVNIPVSALPAAERQSMQGEVSSIDVTESLTVTNAFDDITITPPSGLPGQSGSGDNSNGQGGTTGGNTSGSGSSSSPGDTTGSGSGGSSSGQGTTTGGGTSGSSSSSTSGDTTGPGSGGSSSGQGTTTGGDTSGNGSSSTSGDTTGSGSGGSSTGQETSTGGDTSGSSSSSLSGDTTGSGTN